MKKNKNSYQKPIFEVKMYDDIILTAASQLSFTGFAPDSDDSEFGEP